MTNPHRAIIWSYFEYDSQEASEEPEAQAYPQTEIAFTTRSAAKAHAESYLRGTAPGWQPSDKGTVPADNTDPEMSIAWRSHDTDPIEWTEEEDGTLRYEHHTEDEYHEQRIEIFALRILG